jgi:hypothetical protein
MINITALPGQQRCHDWYASCRLKTGEPYVVPCYVACMARIDRLMVAKEAGHIMSSTSSRFETVSPNEWHWTHQKVANLQLQNTTGEAIRRYCGTVQSSGRT